MRGEASRCRALLEAGGRLWDGEERGLMEDTLGGLMERLELLDSTLEQQCDGMRDRLQDHSAFQVRRWGPGAAILVVLVWYRVTEMYQFN